MSSTNFASRVVAFFSRRQDAYRAIQALRDAGKEGDVHVDESASRKRRNPAA